MIVYLKHTLLLSLAMTLVPMLARHLENRINRRYGMAFVPFDWSFIAQCLIYGIGLPLAGHGLFDLLYHQMFWGDLSARLVSLGLVGLVYGIFFAIQPYTRPIQALFWGVVGGLGTALLYHYLPPSWILQALVVVTLSVLPILSLEIPGITSRRVVRRSPGIVPMRGYFG